MRIGYLDGFANKLLLNESISAAKPEPTKQQTTSLQIKEFPNTNPIPGFVLRYTSSGGFQS